MTFWEALRREIRYGLRTLGRSPGYTVTAILTLGCAIGANTAMFSVINGALLHPLPYRDSGRLIALVEAAPKANQPLLGISIPETWEYRERLRGIDSLVEYHSMTFVLLDLGEADRVDTGVVSSQFFDVFGVRPLYGRTFEPADEVLGAEPVIVLGHEYWQTRFGADPQVVGQTVRMNDKVHTIVGVLPPIPQYPRTNDLFMPTSACPFRAAGERNAHANRRAFANLSVFARLSDEGSVDQVSADAAAIAQGWAQAYPERYQAARTGFQASAERLDEQITREARPILFALGAATLLVLLIACANVANLSVARAIGRERELALRTALGAGRTQLAGQLLAESTLVALAGGALGLLIAWPAAGLLATFASRFTPRAVDASIDGAVLLFTLGASMLTGLACGVLPALVSRRRMTASLRDGGAQAGYSPKRARMGAALVVAQVAVCVSLVVAAGLFVGSLHRLSTVDVGYQDPDHLLTAQLSGNFSRQQQWSAADFIRFHADVLDRVRQLPGVVSAAITNAAPFTGVPGATPFAVDGRGDDAALRPVTDQNVASEDYFAAMGIPLVAGRTFDWSDTPASARVAVINQSMARQWDDRSPLGLTFRTFGGNAASPSSGTAYTVVGIVADARQYSLEQAPVAQFFTPLTQTQGFGAQIVIRTDQDPHQLVRPLKDIVSTLDSAIPVSDVATAAELRAERLRSPRLSTMLLVAFALLALAITLAGIAAVIATSVSQRTREFGVRMALGASRASVLAMVMRQGAWLLIIGLALGTVGAFAFSQVIARYLFAIEHADPFVYTGVAALILLTGLLACLGPARRATAVDPLSALRSD